jgi:hypothetical protein
MATTSSPSKTRKTRAHSFLSLPSMAQMVIRMCESVAGAATAIQLSLVRPFLRAKNKKEKKEKKEKREKKERR